MDTITPERLREHVAVLASDAMAGRATPSPELDRAAAYIAGAFADFGLQAPSGGHQQRIDCDRDPTRGPTSANVIGQIAGRSRPRELVLVTAHYDHLAPLPVTDERAANGDRIYNGANDNASGVAGMLAIAEALADVPMERTVRFVAFCGEELGLLGSRRYIETLGDDELARIEAVVNLEMLGRPAPTRPATVWITGSSYSTLIDFFSDDREVRFIDASAIGPEEGRAFTRSDNWPFARAGVVAHTFATGTIDALYHALGDDAQTLDYEGMAPLVRAIGRGVHRLATANVVPELTQSGKDALAPDQD